MDDLSLLIDLHIGGDRQGPGGTDQTLRALDLSGLKGRQGLRIADIGCGTGASTLTLARELDAQISAVDFLPDFLDKLQTDAAKAGVADKITTLPISMDDLPFADHSLDAIWSEGAIYNIGFEAGITEWKQFLKPGGILAVSELTWLTATRPAALTDYWDKAYPEVATAATKIGQLEQAGYSPLGYFPLPPHCWLENYYDPIQARLPDFLARHDSDAARAIAAQEEEEIKLYKDHQPFVSYGFYIARA